MGIEREVLAWIGEESPNLAARSMAYGAIGIPCKPYVIEYASDVNECLKLLHRIPAIRDEFQKIATIGCIWRATIEAWDELESAFLEECGYGWCKSHNPANTIAIISRINPRGAKFDVK